MTSKDKEKKILYLIILGMAFYPCHNYSHSRNYDNFCLVLQKSYKKFCGFATKTHQTTTATCWSKDEISLISNFTKLLHFTNDVRDEHNDESRYCLH